MMFSKKNLEKDLETNNLELSKLQKEYEVLEKQLREYGAVISKLTQDVKTLYDRLDQLYSTMPVSEPLGECMKNVECGAEERKPEEGLGVQVRETPQCFYLPAPNPDGLFASYSVTKQVGKSIYKLIVSDANNGSFEVLDDDDAVATATISISQFLKPVCRIEGDVHLRPRNIVTLEPGVASREGEGWRVIKKARIEMLR